MNKRAKKGFGLLEVLLASIIIITLILALVFLSRTALSNVSYLQERSQATFLAQEGIEVVRQVRDSNYIDGKNLSTWDTLVYLTGFSVPVAENQYHVYFKDSAPRLTDAQGPNNNYINTLIGNVEYSRNITFKKIDITRPNPLMSNPLLSSSLNPVENKDILSQSILIAVVNVSWEGPSGHKSVEIREAITNSRQGF